MGFSCGLVGLPNAGKTTLFNALTSSQAPAESYPFCTVEPNRGVVAIPDERLAGLSKLLAPEKTTPTTLEMIDIAGLVKGASNGEGLGNQFLAHVQEVDAVAHVVRCFAGGNVAHPYGEVEPVRDLEVVELELVIRDQQMVEKRLEKQRRAAKSGDKDIREEVGALEQIEAALAKGKPVRSLGLDQDLLGLVSATPLLTNKPYFVVANVSDDQIGAGDDHPALGPLRSACRLAHLELVEISAQTESELGALEPGEREAFLRELGLKESGRQRLIRVGYGLLGLVTFYTVVGTEVRAWTVPRETPVARAAGKIHTDMERGFIKAEVIGWKELLQAGSEAAARSAGLLRVEGRDYLVQDGDVLHIRFRA